MTQRWKTDVPKTRRSFPVSVNTYAAGLKPVKRDDFLSSVSQQMMDFLKLVPFIQAEAKSAHPLHSKRFYDYIAGQAALAEALLDSCGAKENRAWFFLRELVAAVCSFAKVSYLLRYLELRLGTYDTLDQEILEFQVITSNVRQVFDTILPSVFAQLEREAKSLGITIPPNSLKRDMFPYFDTPGRLYSDMWVENSVQVDEAIVKIATAYLEIAEEYTALGFSRIFTVQELIEMIPDHVNEERLRTFEADVHNLQSVYDTYIQYTREEAADARLVKLRSFVSIALHLLEIATVLVHFHERHERNSRYPEIYRRLQQLIGTYQMLDIMGNYSLFYCTKFLQKGKELSEETVMDYAQIQSKRIPIPIYRGFHVRPSTYVARIARHYGVDIQMHLGDEVYDAGCVFDLFRANEKINMEKRRLIAKELLTAQHLTTVRRSELPQIVRREFKFLIDEHLLVVHQELEPEDLTISDLEKKPILSAEEVRGVMNELITRLLALGKIDIIMPLSVTFIGDKRALHDIELLAQTGYGEDAKGNNVPLPEELSYLYK
jgi:hypothetical protein